MVVSNDESTYVSERFSILAANGALGLAMVMRVLATFLNIRVAFWVALGIPVSLLGVIFLLPVFDSFIDSVTMTAMVIVLGADRGSRGSSLVSALLLRTPLGMSVSPTTEKS